MCGQWEYPGEVQIVVPWIINQHTSQRPTLLPIVYITKPLNHHPPYKERNVQKLNVLIYRKQSFARQHLLQSSSH
jgi:hypothetical protein